jgi:hypothetical protein
MTKWMLSREGQVSQALGRFPSLLRSWLEAMELGLSRKMVVCELAPARSEGRLSRRCLLEPGQAPKGFSPPP